MAEQPKGNPIDRPSRSSRPSLPSPGQQTSRAFPRALSFDQPPAPITLALEQEEDTHSRETVTSYTPVCGGPSYELSLDIQPKDATTPVLSQMPTAPPESPSIQLIPPGGASLNSEANRPMKEKQQTIDVVQGEPPLFNKRGGSQRFLKRKTPKKNIGTVIGDFTGLYPDELTIKVGEEIEIISKDTVVSRNIGWWTGRNSKGKIGIFPAASVSCDIQGCGNGAGANGSSYPLEIKNAEVTMKEVVGIGGFGKVYRGIYRGEEVAIKVAKTTTFESMKAVQDVIAEAEKFAHLAHVNICALVGVVLVKDVCLVMEYAPGGALSDVLHKSNISLSIDVITNWTAQIAAGMHYLHHESEPSLIHRDLKPNNILLTNVVDPSNLKDNIIKITDFGLAREIEHTTHMSGAGTYPWMAPEVIRTSDFSKKSDVWSFGVVLWELITGERPYGGLNLFVVAYGVGHGTLSLPVPEGCPEPMVKLMQACWRRDHAERPSFVKILKDIQCLEGSDFCTATSHEEFRTMQSTWRGEIQRKFVELKKMEHELQKREQNLVEKISEQEQKRKELEEEKRRVAKQAEILNHLIRQYQQNKEASVVEEADSSPSPQRPPQLVRPPRLRPFSIPRLIRKLWGNETGSKVKVDNPLPDRMESIRVIRRITSSPAPSATDPIRRPSLDRHGSPSKPEGKGVNKKGHKRHSSDEFTGDRERLTIDTAMDNYYRRGSVPNSPNSTRSSAAHQPIIVQQAQQKSSKSLFGSSSLKRQADKKSSGRRQRSSSDVMRSPSPQQLLPSNFLYAPARMGNTPPGGSSIQTPVPTKPTCLGLKGKLTPSHHQEDSNPGSPNVTITPAEQQQQFGLQLYDSGKDSSITTCSSEYSNSSETQPDMIKLDSPVHPPSTTKSSTALGGSGGGIDHITMLFDPLRPSISHDSLLCDSKHTSHYHHATHMTSTSPTPTPNYPIKQQHQHHQHRNSFEGSADYMAYRNTTATGGYHRTGPSPPDVQFNTQNSTSPKGPNDSISPKQSITRIDPSIARPRPKPSAEFSISSAPSSRPPSPRERASSGGYRRTPGRCGGISPTGSVQSMRTFSLDSDGGGDEYTYFDSDVNSNSSSLIDLTVDDDHDTMETIEDINKYLQDLLQ